MRHPLHPLFAHFPVALWTTSIAWDVLGLYTGSTQWWSLGYGCLAAGLVVALPAIAHEFDMSAVALSWVPLAYAMTAAIFLVPFGRAADIHGRWRVFTQCRKSPKMPPRPL